MKETWTLKKYDEDDEVVYLVNNDKELKIENNHRFFQLAQKALDFKNVFGYSIMHVYLTFDHQGNLFDYQFASEEIFSLHGSKPTYEEDHISEVKEKIIFPYLNEQGYTLNDYLFNCGFDEELIDQMNDLYKKFKEKYEAEYQEKLKAGLLEDDVIELDDEIVL